MPDHIPDRINAGECQDIALLTDCHIAMAGRPLKIALLRSEDRSLAQKKEVKN